MIILKIIILTGVPGSGKSTLAKKIVERDSAKWIRICRDNLREMCHPYWKPKREHLITMFEQELDRKSVV
jgi:adenylate kinase family enzyme